MSRYVTGTERECPVCRKIFIPTLEWVYKRNGTQLCSWGCTRKYEKMLESKKKHGKKSKVTEEQKQEVIRMLQAGMTGVQVAAETCLTDVTISKIRKEAGMTARRKEK